MGADLSQKIRKSVDRFGSLFPIRERNAEQGGVGWSTAFLKPKLGDGAAPGFEPCPISRY
jgi:hypothetical protein